MTNVAQAQYNAWTPDPMLTGDTWHQLAVRWDGTNESVFLDGQCACTAPPDQQLAIDDDVEFEIGCDMLESSYTLGAIDEVRMYNRALSDDEMAQLQGVGGRAVPATQACSATCIISAGGP